MSLLPPSVQPDSVNSRQHRSALANAVNALIRNLSETNLGVTTVAKLPTSARASTRAFVTDATSSTFHAAPVGGGSTSVPVFFDGSAWLIG